MTRKRSWEIGAGVLLLLLLVVIGCGLLYQKRINDRLIAAVREADTAAVKSLLARGANPNAMDARFRRALAIAESQEAAVSGDWKRVHAAQIGVIIRAVRHLHAYRRSPQALVEKNIALVQRESRQAYARMPNPHTPIVRLLRQHGATK